MNEIEPANIPIAITESEFTHIGVLNHIVVSKVAPKYDIVYLEKANGSYKEG